MRSFLLKKFNFFLMERLPLIAAQLGVAKLIEGSICRVGDRVRITVQLIDAGLDEHIWSQTFEQKVKDVMLLQNDVAQAIEAAAKEHLVFDDPEAAMALESTYAESGYVAAWLSNAQAFEETYRTEGLFALVVGQSYEYAGEAEKAIDWYELGYQIAGPNVPYLGASVKTPTIQSNPRFIKLLRDMKLDYWADRYSQPGK